VLEDAARHATGLDPVRLVPSLFPRPALLGTGALLLAGLLALLPAYRTPAQRQRQEEATSVAEAGRGLAALTREQLTERKPALEPTEKTLNEVAEFGDKLARLSTTRNEALRDLANLTQKVQDRFEQMGEKPGLRTLEKAAREPSGGSGSAGLEQRVAALGPKGGGPLGWMILERSGALGSLLGSLGIGLLSQRIGLPGALPLEVAGFLVAALLLGGRRPRAQTQG